MCHRNGPSWIHYPQPASCPHHLWFTMAKQWATREMVESRNEQQSTLTQLHCGRWWVRGLTPFRLSHREVKSNNSPLSVGWKGEGKIANHLGNKRFLPHPPSEVPESRPGGLRVLRTQTWPPALKDCNRGP